MTDVISLQCPLCSTTRIFKTKQGYEKGKNKLCVSCTNSIKKGGLGNVRPENGKKLCTHCRIKKPISEYAIYKNGRLHSFCNMCKSQDFKSRYQKTIRFKTYGITKETYDEMYEEQRGKCYICGEYHLVLSIDHNHNTGKVRKLLCKNCNNTLGLVKENVTTLNNMIKYVENENE